MNGLQISMIFFVIVMMGVTFVLVTTIVGKITESSRNVMRRGTSRKCFAIPFTAAS